MCGTLILMDLHGTQTPQSGKEIQCSDCGHRYKISPSQRSSRCAACGNIEFLSDSAEPLAEISRASRELLHKNVIPLLAPRKANEKTENSRLDPFRTTPDGFRVQEILNKYQVEWQLWAMVVKNFGDPAFHGAYMTQILSDGSFDNAINRYQEHRAVMILSRENAWQAEVSDLMLDRVQSLSLMRMKMEGRGFRLPAWMLLLPIESRIFRMGFILFGMLVIARLFEIV